MQIIDSLVQLPKWPLCLAVALTGLAVGCGDAPVDPDPTGTTDPPPTTPQVRQLNFNDTVTATIPSSGNDPGWAVNLNSGQEVNLFLQATSLPSGTIQVVLTEDSSKTVWSNNADTTLECQSTGGFMAPASSTYHFGVSGPPNAQYKLWLYPIDRSPENVSVSFPTDTIIGESIDHIGDVDEFTFNGTAGERYNLFFQSQSGMPATNLVTEVVIPGAQSPPEVESTGADTIRFQATNTFSVSSTQVYTVRVAGRQWNRDCYDRGPYRLFLYPIDWLPETVVQSISVGDSVVDESIEAPGDVDEFTFSVQDSTTVNLVLEHTSSTQERGLGLYLTDNPADTWQPHVHGPSSSRRLATGPTLLEPAKDYQLRVFGSSRGSGYSGGYNLILHNIDRAPEIVSATVVVGDTVEGEEIVPIGDIDEFTFEGEVGQHLTVYFQGQGTPSNWGYFLIVYDPVTDSAVASGHTSTQEMNLTARESGRFTLKNSGAYRMRIAANNGGRLFEEVGPYRFLVHELDADPEVATAAVSLGDSVTTEEIDFEGDVDEFLLTASVGSNVFFQFQNQSGYMSMEIVDATTREVLERLNSFSALNTSSVFTVPASGQFIVRINEIRNCGFNRFTCGYYFEETGPYWFAAIEQ